MFTIYLMAANLYFNIYHLFLPVRKYRPRLGAIIKIVSGLSITTSTRLDVGG